MRVAHAIAVVDVQIALNVGRLVDELEDRHFCVDDLNIDERVERAKHASDAVQQLDVLEVDVVIRHETHVHVR